MPGSQRCRRGRWQTNNMEQALIVVRENNMSFRQASKQSNVPESTLEWHVNKNKIAKDATKHLGRHLPTSFDAEKTVIAEDILDMEKRFFGVTLTMGRRL